MYKLSLDQDADRGPLLNQALYKLRQLADQLYLLGPNVGTLGELPADFEHRFMPSDDSTVAVDVVTVDRTGDDREDLLRICKDLNEPTLIFVKSPNRANEVARWLVEAGVNAGGLPDAAGWLSQTTTPSGSWSPAFVLALACTTDGCRGPLRITSSRPSTLRSSASWSAPRPSSRA